MSGLTILFESAHLLVVNKPPGRLVIPGRNPGSETAPSLREELEAARRGSRLFVVHRLDRDTSGALLFALTAEAHRELSGAFEQGAVRKSYVALVEGQLREPVEVSAALVPARRNRMRVAHEGEVGKAARTRVRPLEVFERCSWVEAEPLTGRTHQIRVHLGSLGHRLLVDPQYGRPKPATAGMLGLAGPAGEVLLGRTPLHARSLAWPELPSVPAGQVEAPLFEDLEKLLERLRRSALEG